MSALDELPLSTSDYIADTQHLTLPQHGAYLLILMTMWRAGGWIADDERKLAIICKVSVAKWRKIAPEVRALLTVRDGRMTQKRLLVEVENETKKREKNRRNGSAGGIAKALKYNSEALPNATVSLGERQNGYDSALPFLPTDLEVRKGRKKEKGGSSLPSDWQPSVSDLSYGADLGLSGSTVDAMAEDMRLWARANSNRAVGRKADWTAAFQGWMRREAGKRRPKQKDGGPTMFEIASGKHKGGF